MLATLCVLVLVVGPLVAGIAGVVRTRREATAPARPATGEPRLALVSALLYTIAFNLTFLVQELGLVLPKALTPGLAPTLYHNDHDWEGTHPRVELLQGTGVLAILVLGVALAAIVQRPARGSSARRLLAIWTAYCGLFMALPQLVTGALLPGSDVGRAMNHLGLGAPVKTAIASLAIAAMPAAAFVLTRPLLALAGAPEEIADGRARARHIARVATLPTLLALPLIAAYRVPREWIEVVMVPAVVTCVGVAWLQAYAAHVRPPALAGTPSPRALAVPLVGAALLLLVFQAVLRRGVAL